MASLCVIDCDVCLLAFCFFKQKTAYEMRISDWSSVVCSSDLFGIVQHHGVGRSVAKAQELLEYPLDRGDVGGDHLIAHQPARFVLEARVADLAGTAAHQHDRLVPRLLKPAQQHDL